MEGQHLVGGFGHRRCVCECGLTKLGGMGKGFVLDVNVCSHPVLHVYVRARAPALLTRGFAP